MYALPIETCVKVDQHGGRPLSNLPKLTCVETGNLARTDWAFYSDDQDSATRLYDIRSTHSGTDCLDPPSNLTVSLLDAAMPPKAVPYWTSYMPAIQSSVAA